MLRMQQKQGLLIFWIIKRMKNGDASEVDGHGERAGAEVTRGRVKLAPGDCEGVKTQEFLCWGPSLEAPSLNFFYVVAP